MKISKALFLSLTMAILLFAESFGSLTLTTPADPPGLLTIVYPVNNASCIKWRPDFLWYTPTGASPFTYRIWLYKGNTPIDTIITIDTAYTLTYDLEPNTTYRWHLDARNATGQSVTNTRTFITGDLPTPTAPLEPIAGALVPVTATIKWTKSEGCPPVKYTLQVWDINSSSYLLNNPNVVDTTYLLNLAAGRNYQWRVRSSNAFGNSSFTNWQVFSTGVNLSAPNLTAPLNGSTLLTPQIPLSWNSSFQADSYVLQISSNPEFTYPLVLYRTVLDTFYRFNIYEAKTHYWRVQARNSQIGSSSPFSEIFSFSVTHIPLTTSIVGPSGSCISLNPTLVWRKAGEDPSILYNLELSSGGTVCYTQTAIFDTSIAIPIPLPANSEMTWHVIPYMANGTGTSAIGNFKTAGPPPPITGIYPPSGANIPNQYFSIHWDAYEECPPPHYYRVEFISDGGINLDIVIHSNFYIVDLLSPYTDYLVKITQFNEYGNGPTAEVNYTSYPGMDVNDESTPSEYNLSQNYPNPFNPVTKIKFGVKSSGRVVLAVYDILGNLIRELMNDTRGVGSYEIEFDGSSLPSGVYFYKLTVNDFSCVKKLMLMK